MLTTLFYVLFMHFIFFCFFSFLFSLLCATFCACSIMVSKPVLKTLGFGFDSRLSSGFSYNKGVTQVKNKRCSRVA